MDGGIKEKESRTLYNDDISGCLGEWLEWEIDPEIDPEVVELLRKAYKKVLDK